MENLYALIFRSAGLADFMSLVATHLRAVVVLLVTVGATVFKKH